MEDALTFSLASIGVLLVVAGLKGHSIGALLRGALSGSSAAKLPDIIPGSSAGTQRSPEADESNTGTPVPADRVESQVPTGSHPCCGGTLEPLVSVKNHLGHRLVSSAAASLARVEAKAGVLPITDTFRDCASQMTGWQREPGRFVHPCKSYHTRGRAIDAGYAPARTAAMDAALRAEGWLQPRPSDEAHHWEYHQ